MSAVEFHLATSTDLDVLDNMVAQYNDFEKITLNPALSKRAIKRLLDDDRLGRIWIIQSDHQAVGYIALCLGYSIEFGSWDAFVDEFLFQNLSAAKALDALCSNVSPRKRRP